MQSKRRVHPLLKKILDLPLYLFTQVYNQVPATWCDGLTSYSEGGGWQKYSQLLISFAMENGISSGLMSNLVCMQTLLNLNLCFILQPQLLFILMELLKERLSHHILLSKINWMVCFHMTAYIFHSKLENKQIFVQPAYFCKKLKLYRELLIPF